MATSNMYRTLREIRTCGFCKRTDRQTYRQTHHKVIVMIIIKCVHISKRGESDMLILLCRVMSSLDK